MIGQNDKNTQTVDSTDAIFQLARTIVPYIDRCLQKIENTKPAEDCKGSSLQSFNSYKKGLIEAYMDIKTHMIRSGFPGTGGIVVHAY